MDSSVSNTEKHPRAGLVALPLRLRRGETRCPLRRTRQRRFEVVWLSPHGENGQAAPHCPRSTQPHLPRVAEHEDEMLQPGTPVLPPLRRTGGRQTGDRLPN